MSSATEGARPAARLALDGKREHEVTPLLVGSNIEAGEEVVAALLSERLRNPRFLGPAEPTTGTPPPWTPAPVVARHARTVELTPGLALSGDASQLLARIGPGRDVSIGQSPVWISAGERLVVSLWALAQEGPATLAVGVRPGRISGPDHASAELSIDAPHWSCYEVELEIPETDDEALFFVRLVGVGAVWLDQVHLRPPDGVLRRETVDRVAELRPGAIRFPGGCLSSAYDWRAGTGPWERRPVRHDPVWGDRLDYGFGTDELLELCQEVGAVPHLTIPLGGSTIDDARDWPAYVADWYRRRDLEPPLVYWHVGNEQWGFWEIGRTSAARYAAVLREWSPLIRAAYPQARIVALGPAEGLGESYEPDGDPWRRTLLDEARDSFDLLAVQHYGLAWGWSEEPAAYAASLRAAAGEVVADVAATVADIRASAPEKRVALSEWNLWSNATTPQRGYREPADGAHVLFAALVLNGLMRVGPEVELANHYSLLNWFGVIASSGRDVVSSPVATALRWYREALPARLVALPTADVAEHLDVACLEGAGGVALFAVNSSHDQPLALEVEGLGASAAAETIAAEAPRAPASERLARVDGSTVELPPLSLTRIRVRR